jgi:hypothetical protein
MLWEVRNGVDDGMTNVNNQLPNKSEIFTLVGVIPA